VKQMKKSLFQIPSKYLRTSISIVQYLGLVLGPLFALDALPETTFLFRFCSDYLLCVSSNTK
jgi:hypothetical protein